MEISPVFTGVGLEMTLNARSSCIKTAHSGAADPVSSGLQRPIITYIQFAATGPTGAANESSAQEEMQNEQVDNIGLLGKVTEDNASPADDVRK